MVCSKNKYLSVKGFTLIELIVVIAILGILAAVVIPKFTGTQQRARLRAHNSNVRILMSAAQTYLSEEGAPTGGETWDGTEGQNWEEYVEEWPEVPSGTGEDAVTGDYEVTISEAGDVTVSPAAVTD